MKNQARYFPTPSRFPVVHWLDLLYQRILPGGVTSARLQIISVLAGLISSIIAFGQEIASAILDDMGSALGVPPVPALELSWSPSVRDEVPSTVSLTYGNDNENLYTGDFENEETNSLHLDWRFGVGI
jgi:hypothetical protein